MTRIGDDFGANRVVLALSFARLADALGNSILFILIPLYVARLPAPAFPVPESVLVGVLISLYGLVNSGAQPWIGALIDRVGRRKPIIQGGLALMGLGTLAFLLASRYLHLVAIRAVQGIGVALTIPASMALMTAATEQRSRGGAMGVYTTLRMAGFAIGPLLGGWLHDAHGFAAAFWVGAALVFLSMGLVELWVKEEPAVARPLGGRPFRVFDRELMTPGILGVAFATFVMAAAFSMMVALENEFNDRLEQGALGFGLAFSALMASRLVFQIPLGRLSDRIGRRPLVIAGLLLMAPTTALLGFVGSTLQLTLDRLVQGIASAAIAAPGYALAADLSSEGGAGRQLSLVTMGFGLGIALGPLMAGVLAVASFELPFVVGAALTLAGAWVVYRWVPESPGPDATVEATESPAA